MKKHKKWQKFFVLFNMVILFNFVPDASAQPQYGGIIDTACRNFNGTAPYTDNGCSLCHSSRYSQHIEPAWTNWFNNDYTAFCATSTVNQAPNGTIISPVSNQTIVAGSSVFFQGNGIDPDNHTPLTYLWSFSGAANPTTVQAPGNIVFNTPGTYSISFTVTDSRGMSDPTPDTRIIIVTSVAPSICTDFDNDGYSIEGGNCGPIDCNDNVSAINPGAAEICGDGVDNNCNGLIDNTDPGAANCGLSCRDNDGDNFSPQGGICGPIDCNDNNPLVNPGAIEHCGDGLDNDCDGATDTADSECSGGDCIGNLSTLQVSSTRANWNPQNQSLAIEGKYNKTNEYVLITSAINNGLLGVTIVNNQGIWKLIVLQPNIVPCRIKVSIAGNSSEASVENAPANCDNTQLPNTGGNNDSRDEDEDKDENGDSNNNNDERDKGNDANNDGDERDENNDDNNNSDDRNQNNDDNSSNEDSRQNDRNTDGNYRNDSSKNDVRESNRENSDDRNSRESSQRDSSENSRNSNQNENRSRQRNDSVQGVIIKEGNTSVSQGSSNEKAALSPIFLLLISGALLVGRLFFSGFSPLIKGKTKN